MDTSDMIREIDNVLSTFSKDYNPGTGNINWQILLSDIKRRMEEMQRTLSKTTNYLHDLEFFLDQETSQENEDLSKLIKDIQRLVK